jgi:hypothetical protein
MQKFIWQKGNKEPYLVFGYSFFIHFFWEMWQMPLFEFSESSDLLAMNWMCTQASLGDGVIAVLAYYFVVYVKKGPWLHYASFKDIALFIVPGIVLTIVMEYLNTLILFRWSYGPLMPIVPVLEIGLAPLLQWILIPPAIYLACNRKMNND